MNLDLDGRKETRQFQAEGFHSLRFRAQAIAQPEHRGVEGASMSKRVSH